MIQNNSFDPDDLNEIAQTTGVPYSIHISPELSELLKPSDFLSNMGIEYSERVKNILSILRGNLFPKSDGLKEAVPQKGLAIPYALAKGPFIREELIAIKAELLDDGGGEAILLSVVLEDD